MTDNNYIKRKIINNESVFFNKNNKKIEDKNILKQISKIYIAPAYTNVKIYLNSNVLATGIDKAGRKQYIYSEKSKELREEKKYCQLVKMCSHIEKLKKSIDYNLYEKENDNKKFSKIRLICIVLKIMDLCNFRIGNKIYEQKYGSYGITTLHKNHMKIYKNHINIEFIGKKGVVNNCNIYDKKFIPILKNIYEKINERKNNYLFDVTMNDINQFLDTFSISSKDIRMWNANIIFLRNLHKELGNNYNGVVKKKIIISCIKKTAEALHNTAAICKKSYIYKELYDIDKIVRFQKKDNYEDILKNILKRNKNYKLCL